jgi:hypothetical protein
MCYIVVTNTHQSGGLVGKFCIISSSFSYVFARLVHLSWPQKRKKKGSPPPPAPHLLCVILMYAAWLNWQTSHDAADKLLVGFYSVWFPVNNDFHRLHYYFTLLGQFPSLNNNLQNCETKLIFLCKYIWSWSVEKSHHSLLLQTGNLNNFTPHMRIS